MFIVGPCTGPVPTELCKKMQNLWNEYLEKRDRKCIWRNVRHCVTSS